VVVSGLESIVEVGVASIPVKRKFLPMRFTSDQSPPGGLPLPHLSGILDGNAELETAMRNNRTPTLPWKIAYWILLPCWIVGAGLHMWRVSAGFLTNYLADLTFPPWYYLVIRSQTTTGMTTPRLLRWFGASPERTVLSVLVAGIAYELAQRWHLIEGTFDWWDVAVYGFGLGVCLIIEKRRPS
jgi:hypothetical protein